jgi:hypothetical protein
LEFQTDNIAKVFDVLNCDNSFGHIILFNIKSDLHYKFRSCFRFKDFVTNTGIYKFKMNDNTENKYKSTFFEGISSYNEEFKNYKVSREMIFALKDALKYETISKENENHKESIVKIISLPFICESSRNSTTFMIVLMYFDLITSGHLKIENIDNEFPMAMKGAVSASRSLSKIHKFDYKYDKDGHNKHESKALFEQELNIINKWKSSFDVTDETIDEKMVWGRFE